MTNTINRKRLLFLNHFIMNYGHFQSILICLIELSVCIGYVDIDICNSKGLCDHTNRSVDFNESSCYCNQEDCWLYDYCCRDEKPSLKSYKKVEMNCEGIPNTNENVYIANSCPSDWDDENIHLLCKKNVLDEDYAPILDIPYLSTVTNILYSNIYCARCNEDDRFANGIEASLQCEPSNQNPCDRKAVMNSSYDAGELRWQPNNKSITSISLHVDISTFRKCRIVNVKKCASNWTDSLVAKKCQSHTNYVEKKNTIYRNLYCALCNNVKVNELSCVRRIKKAGIFTSFNYQSFAEILNFRKSKCAKNEEDDPLTETCWPSKCAKNEEDDPLTETCRPTLCASTFTKINGKCEPKMRGQHQSNVIFFSTILTIICLVVSLISLLCHLIIRFITEDMTRIPEKNLMNLSVALFVAQMSFILGAINNITKITNFCLAVGIVTHFFYLAVFFWMNVISYDMYSTLSKCEVKSNEKFVFKLYFCYAWFLPLIIVTIAIISDQTNLLLTLKPDYAVLCWITRKFALFVFFALPLAIILIVNIVFFILTARKVHLTVRKTRLVKKSSQYAMFCVYVKLALVMGLTWVTGFVANFIDFEPLLYVFIILNASQGTFLFVAFTLKSRVIRRLCSKLPFAKRRKASTRFKVYVNRTEETALTN